MLPVYVSAVCCRRFRYRLVVIASRCHSQPVNDGRVSRPSSTCQRPPDDQRRGTRQDTVAAGIAGGRPMDAAVDGHLQQRSDSDCPVSPVVTATSRLWHRGRPTSVRRHWAARPPTDGHAATRHADQRLVLSDEQCFPSNNLYSQLDAADSTGYDINKYFSNPNLTLLSNANDHK